MLCSSCQKLAINIANKKCVRCKGLIQINIAVICDGCSSKEKLCSICLKKIMPVIKTKTNGCGCGKK